MVFTQAKLFVVWNRKGHGGFFQVAWMNLVSLLELS